MVCPYKTPGCDGNIFNDKLCAKCRAPHIYAHETDLGIVVSFGAKWGIYTGDGILRRELSQQDARAIVDRALMCRSLPSGEDR
jgi:hypothetical protein